LNLNFHSEKEHEMYVAYCVLRALENFSAIGNTPEGTLDCYLEQVRKSETYVVETPPSVKGKEHFIVYFPDLVAACEACVIGAGDTKEDALESMLESLKQVILVEEANA
jgi:hypothetical protein